MQIVRRTICTRRSRRYSYEHESQQSHHPLPLFLPALLGAGLCQWRRSPLQRLCHHPQERHQDRGEDPGGHRECQEGIPLQMGWQDPPEPEAAPARRRHRPPRRSQLRQRLLRQRQQQRAARRGGPQARAHHRPAGGLFRLLCPGVDHLLPLQHQRQPRHRLRIAEHPEVVRR